MELTWIVAKQTKGAGAPVTEDSPRRTLDAVPDQTSYPRNVLFCVVFEIEISAVFVRIEHCYALHIFVLLRSRNISNLSAHFRARVVLPCEGSHFLCGNDSVAMNGHRVFHLPRIASGESDHHGNAANFGHLEDEFVALLQSFHRQIQAAELVFTIGIGSGDVAQQIGIELAEAGT